MNLIYYFRYDKSESSGAVAHCTHTTHSLTHIAMRMRHTGMRDTVIGAQTQNERKQKERKK